MKNAYLLAGALAITTAAQSHGDAHHHHEHQNNDEKIQSLGPHVHGEGQLNVTLDGHDLSIRLDTPSMNVLGFEHKPSTAAQKETVEKAEHELGHADELFDIHGATCKLESKDIDMPFEDAHDHEHKGEHKHEHKGEHKHEQKGEHKHEHKDEHKHEQKGEHKHEQKGEHKHEQKGEHKHEHKAEHKHEHEGHHHEHGVHSDIAAEYKYHCDNAKQLDKITVELFEVFPNFEKINVQWINDDQQGIQTLTPSDHELKLK